MYPSGDCGCSRWKTLGLFNCYSSHLMHVDGWREERYYFSKVFRPGSLDSQPWCKRALQAYTYSSRYCHVAFEGIPILTCLSVLFYVSSFREPIVAFSSTCNGDQLYVREGLGVARSRLIASSHDFLVQQFSDLCMHDSMN